MKKPNKITLSVITLIVILLLVGTAYWFVSAKKASTNSTSSSTNSTESSNLNIDNGDEDIDWSALPTKEIALSDNNLKITEAGTYVLSGTTTTGVTVETTGNVRLILNNATISSQTTAAIYVISADNTVIQTQEGTTNTIKDSSNHSDIEVDGTIYSADDLILQGDGKLIVQGVYADGIVGKDDLKINSGTIEISATDDGIRGKDSVVINGGTITVDAKGDGIKSTNDTDLEKGYTYIKDGTLTITAGDDAVKGETKFIMDGGTLNIPSSTEGIEAANITINGGTIDLYATDDGINATADTMGTTVAVTINGGDIKIKVGSGDTDGIDSNGDITINGGTIDITGQVSTIDYEGTGILNGGTLILNGTQSSTLPQGMGGGGGGPMMR